MPSGEKAGRWTLRRRAARSLKSGLPITNRKIRALFAYFSAERAKILCSSDCVAEEERFELSVRFCRAKARRVRKLQIANPAREFRPKPDIRTGQLVRFRFAIYSYVNGECQAMLWQKWSLCPAPGSLIRFACDCVLAGSHKTESFSRQANYIEADLWQL